MYITKLLRFKRLTFLIELLRHSTDSITYSTAYLFVLSICGLLFKVNVNLVEYAVLV